MGLFRRAKKPKPEPESVPEARRRDGRRIPPPARIIWPILAAVAGAALVLDFVFFTGLFASDDANYLVLARDVLVGSDSGGHLLPSRLGVVLPAAAALWLARGEAQTAALLFVGFHLGLLLVVYELGTRLHGYAAGLTAAALTAFCPLLILYSGCVLPDIPAALFLVASFTVVLPRAQAMQSAPPSARWWFAAGILAGAAYMVKEASMVFVPALAVMALWPAGGDTARQRPARAGAVLAGFATVLLVHLVLVTVLYGSPGVLVKSLDFDPARLQDQLARDGTYPWDRWMTAVARLKYQLGVFATALLVGLAGYPFVRRRSWALWGTSVWLMTYNIWGSISPSMYLPPPLQARYFIGALAFAIVCLAAVLTSVVSRILRSTARWAPANYVAKAAWGLAGLAFLATSVTQVNNLAGRIYYAPEVNGLSQALDFALLNDRREIVISPMLSYRCRPLFFGGKHPEIRLVSREWISQEDADRLLSGDGILYICMAQEQAQLASRDGPSIRQSVEAEAAEGRADLNSLVALALLGEPSSVRVRMVATFYAYNNRLDAMLRWRNWHPGWVRRTDLNRGVYLYEVRSATD